MNVCPFYCLAGLSGQMSGLFISVSVYLYNCFACLSVALSTRFS